MTAAASARSAAEWLQAGEAARQRGLLAEARSAFAAAAEVADDACDDDALVAAALSVGGMWVYEQRDVLERVRLDALWERAVSIVAPGSLAAHRLAVRLAAEAVYEGAPVANVRRTVAELRASIAAGGGGGTSDVRHGRVQRDRRAQDHFAVAEALSLLHHCLLDASDAGERLGVAEEMLRWAAGSDDPVLPLMGLCWRTVDLYLLGDRRAPQSRVELAGRADAAGCEAVAFAADVMAAMEAARGGDLDGAEAAATAALERGLAAGDPDAPAYYGAMLATLRWWQGRAGEVVGLARAEASSPRLGGNAQVYDAAAGLLSAISGDLVGASESVQRLTASPLSDAPKSSARLAGLFLLGEIAFLTGDEQVANAVAAEMSAFADVPVLPSLAVVCLGSARRTLGLASCVAGRIDDASRELEAAIAVDRRLGNRPMAALTQVALGWVLAARGGEGDRDRAESLLASARDLGAAMGMALPDAPEWLRAEARRRIRAAHGPPEHAADAPDAPDRASPASAPHPHVRLVLRRRGRQWVLTGNGRTAVLADRVGFAYLAVLLDAPGVDVDVLALAGVDATPAMAHATRGEPVLDGPARRAYKARMRKLADALDDFAGGDAAGSAGRTVALREMDELRRALASGTALRGRWRTFPDAHERARTSVRKALLRSIEAITAADPEVGAHLRRSIRTGAMCRYDPA